MSTKIETLDMSTGEQCYRTYQKEKTVKALVAWFRAELSLQSEVVQSMYGEYSDEALRMHSRRIEQLARRFRQERQIAAKNHAA